MKQKTVVPPGAVEKAEAKRVRDLAAAKRRRAAARAIEMLAEELACEAWLQPVIRVVPAAECEPIGRVGVRSVFELGCTG